MLVPHLKPTDMQAFIQKYEKCLRSTPNGGPVPIGILVTILVGIVSALIGTALAGGGLADLEQPVLLATGGGVQITYRNALYRYFLIYFSLF